MELLETRLEGPKLIAPRVIGDDRGFFAETYRHSVFAELGIPEPMVQDNHSRSDRGIVRGMHFQIGDGAAKLVRCGRGAIYDVVVDLRPASPTYRNWASFERRDDEQVTLYVPTGCAHGFQTLTDPANVSYRIDRAHDPTEDVSIAFDDPELAHPVAARSEWDRFAPPLAAAMKLLT